MHRADLPDVRGAKSIKHVIGCDDRLEEAPYGIGVVGPRLAVIPERDRIGDFIWPTVELRTAPKFPNQIQKTRMKLGNAHRAERKARSAAIRCCADDRMIEKIEGDLHAHRAVRDY